MPVSIKRHTLPLLSALMIVPPFVAVSQTSQSVPTPAVPAASASTVVPPLIPFAGAAFKAEGQPLASPASIAFLIFNNETGGEPLFAETQTVALHAAGHYMVQLARPFPMAFAPTSSLPEGRAGSKSRSPDRRELSKGPKVFVFSLLADVFQAELSKFSDRSQFLWHSRNCIEPPFSAADNG
jgi:hypothetical protein